MNSRKHRLTPTAKLHLILLAIICASAMLFSGCGSAEAKKGGSKKAKQAKSEVAKEETEAEAEEPVDEEHAADEEKNVKEDKAGKAEKAEKTSKEDKAEAKKGEKTDSAKVPKKESEKSAAAKAIWANLAKGNQRFVAGKPHSFQQIAARRELTKGQHPQAIVLGCADSRLSPELIFDQNMGDLFVVRTAGNVADPVALGSLEYAAEHLQAKVLIVLGHESCGAVAAAISGDEMPSKNLNAIVSKIQPAFEGSKSCALGGKGGAQCVELNVARSAKDILAKSPLLREKAEAGELTVIRAVYHLETGEVTRLD